MEKLTLPAEGRELDKVIEFVGRALEPYPIPPAERMRIELAVEEVFVNIANYAYAPEKGEAEVSCGVSGEPPVLTVVFSDSGREFDPLKKEDADTSREALLSREGGLGIFLVKKNVDEVSYKREGGRNVLTLRKSLRRE